jgi:predicted phage baseplate assembly protein
MSRPPIYRRPPSPRGDPATPGTGYFDPDFAALVALAETVARDGPGLVIPPKGRGLARTLIELPAVLAHLLGAHQSLYAREAFIATAQLPDSLTRHARKLAYEPDAGVAATGLAAFTAKPGLAGTLHAGFGLQSTAKGEVKAQAYETLEPLELNAAWNALRPADAMVPTPMVFADGLIELPLASRHGLDRDAVVLLEGQGRAAVLRVDDPLDDAPTPRIRLRRIGGPLNETWPVVAAGYRLHSRPAIQERLFGSTANPSAFPPDRVAVPTAYVEPTDTATNRFGYVLPTGAAVLGSRLYLVREVDTPAQGAFAALVSPSSAEALRVTAVDSHFVQFRVGLRGSRPTVGVSDTGAIRVGTEDVNTTVETGARVTALGLADATTGSARTFATNRPFPLDATLLTSWAETVAVAPLSPNPVPLGTEVPLAEDLSTMRPGRTVILRHTGNGTVIAATLTRLQAPIFSLPWTVTLAPAAGATIPADFTRSSVEILANVARVSHGETKVEVAGGSDGVTPHQSFALKGTPVTRLPGAMGAEIALSVRVGGVLWELREDFHAAGPDTPALRADTDAEGTVTLRFGGEGRGAVPPAGRRSIEAAYREGLGRIGDIEAGRLVRIRKASPLIDAVTNPLPVRGGTDPASTDDLVRQATRPVRLFDRAVSVADHADLALLFPGVARAAARWTGYAVEVTAADATGAGIADRAALRAFLDARRDTTLPLLLLDPQPVDVSIALRVERSAAHLADAVRLAVQEALLGEGPPPGLFAFASRALSAPQSLSGLYACLRPLAGVTGLEATRFALAPDSGVADILHATDRQWLRLLPSALDITIVEPGLLTQDIQGGRP